MHSTKQPSDLPVNPPLVERTLGARFWDWPTVLGGITSSLAASAIAWLSSVIWKQVPISLLVAVAVFLGMSGSFLFLGARVSKILNNTVARLTGTVPEISLHPDIAIEITELTRTTNGMLRRLPTNNQKHPAISTIRSLFRQLNHNFLTDGPQVIEVDPDYYADTLPSFEGTGGVRAIADLSVEQERKLWNGPLDRLQTSGQERVFLIDGRDFFRPGKLNALQTILAKLATRSQVRFSHAPPFDRRTNRHFDQEAGHNMLLIPPHFVAGYSVKRNNNDTRRLLRFSWQKSVYEEVGHEYEEIARHSIPFESGMKPIDLRKAWMRKWGIGFWKSQWTGIPVMDRLADYFEHYDFNIRAWIPDYDELTWRCSELALAEINRLLRKVAGSLHIMEIGFGTGALTSSLLEWIVKAKAAGAENCHYFGIDAAKNEMLPRLQSRMKSKDDLSGATFEQGIFWNSQSPRIEERRPFDVICGSLVMHDLISSDDPTRRFRELLQSCKLFLRAGGSLVFADSIPKESSEQRRIQESKWREWMDNMTYGDCTQRFFSANRDMIHTITEDSLVRIAGEEGFAGVSLHPVSPWSPFQVAVFRSS